jgi:hypothetical protein
MILGAPHQLARLQLGQLGHILTDPFALRSQPLPPSRPTVGHDRFGQTALAFELLFGASGSGGDDAKSDVADRYDGPLALGFGHALGWM